ncbi:MAG: integration host factor subunit alpha [Deltaproteobacteria bacterium]|jgi:integration host factor subunit alpha|nr:integration host factor subunit alpha [Deltaproteobacteria bacterium]
MTLTKEKLIRRLSEATDKPVPMCTELVDKVLSEMKLSLQAGQDVLISGFGKFCVIHKSPRKGRNPQTNSTIELASRKVVTFRPSSKLKDYLNDE